MISKNFPGHSFYHAARYMCNKPEAEVLATEGVRGHDYRLMAEDFNRQHELRPSKKQACFHSVLSFYPGENPGDATITEIARNYLKGLGIINTQYAIVKHSDKKHVHVHILANMVNNDGKVISDSWIGFKGKKLAQQLTQEYKLIQVERKNLSLTNMEALTESQASRYTIYMAMMEILPGCRSLEELESRLMDRGIITQYKYKSQTQEKQGISFKIGSDCFKGSKIDRKFSLAGLQKIIAYNLRHQRKPSISAREAVNSQGSISNQLLEKLGATADWLESIFRESQQLGSLGITAIDALLKAEPAHEQGINPALLEEARRKKKRKKTKL
jgi:hypothetical protein